MSKLPISKKSAKMDRVPLSKEAVAKIDRHIRQIEEYRSGVVVSRKDYIEDLIKELPESLKESDVKKYAQVFFNEEKFLRFLMTQVKDSKKTGEDFDLSQFIQQEPGKTKRKKVQNSNVKRGKLLVNEKGHQSSQTPATHEILPSKNKDSFKDNSS